MRDAENGPEFRDFLKQRFGIEARTISGDEEARLTFLGATSDRNDDDETVVIDIGGGSTEYVVGRPGHDPGFHVSTQMGSVRYTERFLHSDPPARGARASWQPPCARPCPTCRWSRASRSPARPRRSRRSTEPRRCTATGSTSPPASASSRCSPRYRSRSAGSVRGLHPDRAPTIVAGAVILTESIRALGLSEIEVSVARHPPRRRALAGRKRIARIMRAIPQRP